MSLMRRVKSFSIKKSSSTDELKSTDATHQKQKSVFNRYRTRKNLSKQKSLSEEVIPFRLDLESNDLFKKQRNKHEYEDNLDSKIENKTTSRNERSLKRRESRSLDESNFYMCIKGDYYNKDDYYSNTRPPAECLRHTASTSDRIRRNYSSRYRTVDVMKDLINEFSEESKNATEEINKPRNFPIPETDRDDEDVQYRGPRPYKQPIERPKTYSSSLATKKKEDIFEFTRPCHLEIGSDKCMKIKNNDLVKISNGQLEIFDKEMRPKLKINKMKKGVKLITKKELEISDSDNTIYRFYFDSTKDAKLFIDEIAKPSPSKSSGPWNNLLRLLRKRSSRDLLESKGIIKNEPIFGNTLQELCDSTRNPVPEVITRLVKIIEEPENIRSVGLYRASGNLAIIQHIRCEINCGKWDVLEKFKKDVDVLTGTLKLFFRELKEPLIPYEFYERLRRLTGTTNEEKLIDEEIIKVVESLPEPNKATLLYIIEHLLKVCRYKKDNKMDLHNISICWGPSLTVYSSTANCHDLVSQTTECTTIIERILTCYYSKVVEMPSTSSPVVTNEDRFVYQIVKKITTLIESNLDVEGIYRKSGSNTKIDNMIKVLNTKDINKCLNELDKYKAKSDIHDLCCVLKKFLGSLSQPLIPDDFLNVYCEICDNLDYRSTEQRVKEMIASLPRKDILLLLMQHLRRVLEYESKNKTSLVTTTDIWMTTLTSNTNLQQYKKNTQKFPKLFQILINYCSLPDLVPNNVKNRDSRYDNVDDIYYESDITGKSLDTKL